MAVLFGDEKLLKLRDDNRLVAYSTVLSDQAGGVFMRVSLLQDFGAYAYTKF